MTSLTQFVSRATSTLREAAMFIAAAVSVFLAGMIIGLLHPVPFTPLLDVLRTIADRFQDQSTAVIIGMLLLQNATAGFISVWLGAIFGIVPLSSALINGILMGLVFSLSDRADAASLLWALAPHGIFEMPAIFIAWGLGLWRGTWLFRNNRQQSYRQRALRAYQTFAIIVLPLLVIAATIEGWRIAAATGL